MNLEAQFGELRSFLEKKPSSRTFDLILQLLEAGAKTNEAKVRAEWLPYAAQRLERWPDHARLCPKTRNAEYIEGDALWHSLVRGLDFVGDKMGKNQMEEFLSTPGLEQLTSLDMRSTSMTWDKVSEFATRAPFKLERFGFRRVSSIDRPALDTLFSSEMLSQCEEFTMRGWDKIRADVFDSLIAHFPLQRLRVLDMTGGVVSTKQLKNMLATGQLDDLEELHMGVWVSDKRRTGFIDAIVKHGGLTKLRVLHVENHKPKEIEALAACEGFSNLRELCLYGELTTESLEQILESPNLPALESLRVELEASTAHTSLALLSSSSAVENLKKLHLCVYESGALVTRQHYLDLVDSPNLSNLTHLALTLGSEDVIGPLLGTSNLPNLEELMLVSVHGNEKDLQRQCDEAFANVTLPKLTRFVINDFRNTGAVIESLGKSPFLARLEGLRVHQCKAARMVDLFKSPQLANLEVLDLSLFGYPESRQVLPKLAQCEHLGSLRCLLLDSQYRIADLATHCAENEHTLPELLHIGCPEYAMFQANDWME